MNTNQQEPEANGVVVYVNEPPSSTASMSKEDILELLKEALSPSPSHKLLIRARFLFCPTVPLISH